MQVATVTIMRDETPVRINREEYTPDMGAIVESDPILTAEELAALQGSATVDPALSKAVTVIKKGKEFFLADASGAIIEGQPSYKTDAEAWGVIMGGSNA